MLEKIKSEYTNKVDKHKHINKLKSDKLHKEQELKRLTEYSDTLETIIQQKFNSHREQAIRLRFEVNDIEYKLDIEKMTMDTLRHMFSRDK